FRHAPLTPCAEMRLTTGADGPTNRQSPEFDGIGRGHKDDGFRRMVLLSRDDGHQHYCGLVSGQLPAVHRTPVAEKSLAAINALQDQSVSGSGLRLSGLSIRSNGLLCDRCVWP